ncbi:MAG: hypothetical protein O2967_15645 [Proteobacteria bacterium]|nr:hypothetical protein [Pseudomonadota bacterium]
MGMLPRLFSGYSAAFHHLLPTRHFAPIFQSVKVDLTQQRRNHSRIAMTALTIATIGAFASPAMVVIFLPVLQFGVWPNSVPVIP